MMRNLINDDEVDDDDVEESDCDILLCMVQD